jgi:ribosome-associated translation inhibitor RaiA
LFSARDPIEKKALLQLSYLRRYLYLQKDSNMKVQLNTDAHIEGTEALSGKVNSIIEQVLFRFKEHITRLEVHLIDEKNGKRGQPDYRCNLEGRLKGRQPVAVTANAATLVQAVDGATQRLEHLLESTLGRMHKRPLRKDISSEE